MSDDPFELVRRADPVRPDTLVADPAEAARASGLFDTIVSGPRRPSRRGHMLLAAAAVVVAALVAVGGYVASDRSPARPTAVGCFATADSTGSELLAHTQSGRTPSSECGELWQLGAIGGPSPAQLSECHGHDATLPVVPGPVSTCPTSHPAPAGGAPGQSATTANAAVDALRTALAKGLGRQECLTAEAGKQLAEEAVAAIHLAGWTVQEAGAGAGTASCTLLYVNVVLRSVQVIVDPRQG
jgi:hypothetical protein